MRLPTYFRLCLVAYTGSLHDDRGASLVEYALLVAFIALVCVAAMTLLGNSVSPKFSSVGQVLSSSS